MARITLVAVAVVTATACFAAPAPALDFCALALRECARVVVPLDRSGAVPGTVALQVERQRAPRATRAPIFLIAGGPGESATRAFDPAIVTALLGEGFGARDVIVVDLRGTGDSGALRCPELQSSELPSVGAAVSDCAARLGPRRAFFTTRDNVADLEAVREAIGAPQIALYGASYGSQVALAYALSHPDRVDRLVLDSVVPADGQDPLLRSSMIAAPRVMRSFCAAAGCRSVTRDAGDDLARLARRLAIRSLRGPSFDSLGRPHRTTVAGSDLLDLARSDDLNPGGRAQLPGAVRNALRGDGAPILRLERQYSAPGPSIPPRALSAATFVATSCEESRLPWVRTAPPGDRLAQAQQAVRGLPAAEFGAFGPQAALASELLDLCLQWPAAPDFPALGPTQTPAAPALLIAGDQDVRTPVEDARRVATSLPGARLLVARGAGHSVLSNDEDGCVTREVRRFLDGEPSADCPPVSLPVAVRRFPLSLHDTPPAGGTAGRLGRTLAAVRLTVRDATPEFDRVLDSILTGKVLRTGGVRGGWAAVSDGGARLALHRFSFIPGVRVRGSLAHFDSERAARGRLSISGRTAARGTLTVHGRTVKGRLGGRPVRARLNLNLFDLTD